MKPAPKDAVLNTRYHGAYVVAHLPGTRAGNVAAFFAEQWR
jgi:hypothetical protein